MDTKMTEIQSIKFFSNVPSVHSGRVTNDVKSTYIGVDGKLVAVLNYRIENEMLTITYTSSNGETKHFIYKMSDIVGRIEVTELEN